MDPDPGTLAPVTGTAPMRTEVLVVGEVLVDLLPAGRSPSVDTTGAGAPGAGAPGTGGPGGVAVGTPGAGAPTGAPALGAPATGGPGGVTGAGAPSSLAIHLEGHFGGSPANVAVGLARLECPVGFAGRLARGGWGPWLRAHLEAEGVDLGSSIEADEPCTLAVVTLDPFGTATYELYSSTTADWAWRAEELPDPARLAGACVHTGSLATALAPGAGVLVEWLRRLRGRDDVVISYDPNLRPSLIGGSDRLVGIVAPVIECAHLVKVSEEDLGALAPGEPVGKVVSSWLTRTDGVGTGPTIVVVTEGPAGATAWHRDGRCVHRGAPAVTVADTVGAGDAFCAGLISSLSAAGALGPTGLATLDDETLEWVLDRAAMVAALTCARPGADPPRLADLTGGRPSPG